VDIGTDIIEVVRIGRAIERRRFFERVFTERERNRAGGMKEERKRQYFSGLFAAKEAAIKVLGGTIFSYEIGHDDRGKPFFIGRENLKVSISHTKEMAMAVVIQGDD
jgi:holo-[acyl-carrier protein] synthase